MWYAEASAVARPSNQPPCIRPHNSKRVLDWYTAGMDEFATTCVDPGYRRWLREYKVSMCYLGGSCR